MQICPPSLVTYDAARNERQIKKYLANSSAPLIGIPKTPRIIICASGVRIKMSSKNTLNPRTVALMNSRSRVIFLFHVTNFFDVGRPFWEIFIDLSEHCFSKCFQVKAIFTLDENHAFGFKIFSVFRRCFFVPI